MKLVIQIPCYNEEANLKKTIENLPKKIEGIDEIQYIVINDGSTDNTENIVKKLNLNYINIYPNKGLANAFKCGIDESLKMGADIIVNIDGDNQYNGKDIGKLVKPILDKKADMVIGERQIEKFKPIKRFFQKIGSFIVRKISNTNVPDAPSGFRAISRECAMRMNVFNEFTYTLETIIQMGKSKFKIFSVKIESNPDTRKSRLFKNNFEYIRKSMINIIKATIIYKPTISFFLIGVIMIILGTIILLLNNNEKILIASMFIIFTGINSILIAIKSNIDVANRKLLEDIQYMLKENKYNEK